LNYASHNISDTIVALATPPGIGAIGVIRLSGVDAVKIANQNFKSKDLEKQDSHTLHFGTVRHDDGKIIDEVVLSLFIAPKSYTGENVVEISCHGSNYIIQELIQLFMDKGARMAQPGEFTLRAFLNGRMDLSQAEAVADLIASTSESSHEIAIQQMRGGFSEEIKVLRQELIDFASLIELELDFAEEDVEFADRTKLVELVKKIQKIIYALLQSFKLGNVIKNGVSTVLAGRPNAGKSTLLNALLNEERAIVSDIAGTTRDTIEEILNIDGIEFRLIDTAGIRDAQDQIEAFGVQKTMEKIASSALLLYVFDVLEMKIDEVLNDLEKLQKDGLHILVVCNKMDKSPYFKPEWLTNPETENIPDFFFSSEARVAGCELRVAPEQIVATSALNKMNIPYLKEKLYESVMSQKVNLDQTVVTNVRHYDALQKAYDSLEDVLRGMDMEVTSDFIAMDIRQALHHLGSIVGEVSTDDLLGNIFGRFCIGK
jgi:tRNA modification GTPase